MSGPVGARVTNNGAKCQRFCFTLNNPTTEEMGALQIMEVQYAVDTTIPWRYGKGQLEMQSCLHVQGYCALYKQRRYTTIRAYTCPITGVQPFLRCAMFKCRGGESANIRYVSKRDTRVEHNLGWSFEFGIRNMQGKRDKIRECDEVAIKLRDEDYDLDDIEEEHPGFYMMNKGKVISQFLANKGKRDLPVSNDNIHIYVGESGSGKTETAKYLYPDAFEGRAPVTQNGRWFWDNYKGEEVVVFNEFNPENYSYENLKLLFDKNAMNIEWKHGAGQMVSTRIVLTTTVDPKTWLPAREDKTELQRRIREYATIFDFPGQGTWPHFVHNARTEEFEFDPYIPNPVYV